MESLDVSVVGSINTDLSVFTDVVPSAGETVMGAQFVMGYGGKGANQCVATQFLGSRSAIVSKVGSDCFADRYLKHLNAISVNTEGIIRTDEASTGLALITVQRDRGENRIIVVPGSNMLLTTADVDSAAKAGFLDAGVVLCQLEITAATTLHALKLAHSKGRITVLNPAPSPSKAPGNAELLSEMLKVCDYCCPNETEALQLINISTDRKFSPAEEGCLHNYITCLSWLADCGVRYPIVTMGSEGLIALVPKSSVPEKPTKDVSIEQQIEMKGETKCVVRLKAPHVPTVVDTTGAGDCFVGAFAHFLACHRSIGVVEQLRRAVWIASKSVQKVGTQSSFPKRTELPAAIFGKTVFEWPKL
ncbi:Ribokinase [Fasciola gigantica]|uniref:Ribokinase n=1 Tax=Fasciola gigantica TaxID=46835 RepID=A0A504YJV0_FASGI|nr:Ribokinase [Fasciola gigantica]